MQADRIAIEVVTLTSFLYSLYAIYEESQLGRPMGKSTESN